MATKTGLDGSAAVTGRVIRQLFGAVGPARGARRSHRPTRASHWHSKTSVAARRRPNASCFSASVKSTWSSLRKRMAERGRQETLIRSRRFGCENSYRGEAGRQYPVFCGASPRPRCRRLAFAAYAASRGLRLHVGRRRTFFFSFVGRGVAVTVFLRAGLAAAETGRFLTRRAVFFTFFTGPSGRRGLPCLAAR